MKIDQKIEDLMKKQIEIEAKIKKLRLLNENDSILKKKKQKENFQEISTNLHHYCILRDDLPYGVSHAQLLHAAGESNPGAKHAYAVVLSVPYDKLLNLKEQLSETNIDHICIHESDYPYDGELTAIGIEPVDKSENKNLRRIVAGLKLLR